MNRRGFLGSILALGAAPAIVRADSLMRIVPLDTSIIVRRPGFAYLGDEFDQASLVQYGDGIVYDENAPWAFSDKMPEHAQRDADAALDRIAAELGKPVLDREYTWFPRSHRDKSDPFGQYAAVSAKGYTAP